MRALPRRRWHARMTPALHGQGQQRALAGAGAPYAAVRLAQLASPASLTLMRTCNLCFFHLLIALIGAYRSNLSSWFVREEWYHGEGSLSVPCESICLQIV